MNDTSPSDALEVLFLTNIRSVTVLFVAGLALFNFTNLGKTFSIISLLGAFILLFTILADYFIQRKRISDLGFYPRAVIDIIAFVMVGVILLILWIIYTVWNQEPTSIGDLAKEVESEIQKANRELIESIKDVNEKILLTNQALISNIQGKHVDAPTFKSKLVDDQLSSGIVGAVDEQQQNTVNLAALAAVSA